MDKRFLGFALATAAVLAGCTATSNTAYRIHTVADQQATVITVDAKLREILVSQKQLGADGKIDKRAFQRFCSAPSPDVFSVMAQSLGAGGSFGRLADPKNIEATFNLALSSAEQGANIRRTQTMNMLRELMFRTCERYLSGAYDEAQVAIQAVRDQRLIVSILAIEQLTGAVTPKPVVIGATSAAAAGVTGDALVRLDDARKAKEASDTAYAGAKAAFDRANGNDKVCDALQGKAETDLTDPQKEAKKPCDDAREAVTKAEGDRATKTSAYQELALLARSGGASAGTTFTSTATGGLDSITRESIKDVTDAVARIVQSNFNDSTETMLFCMRVLQARVLNIDSYSTGIETMCSQFLEMTVGTSLERERGRQLQLKHQADAAAAAMSAAGKDLFQQFWTSDRQAAFGTVLGREGFARSLADRLSLSSQNKANCFRAADNRAKAQDCFGSLTPAEQQIAITL